MQMTLALRSLLLLLPLQNTLLHNLNPFQGGFFFNSILSHTCLQTCVHVGVWLPERTTVTLVPGRKRGHQTSSQIYVWVQKFCHKFCSIYKWKVFGWCSLLQHAHLGGGFVRDDAVVILFVQNCLIEMRLKNWFFLLNKICIFSKKLPWSFNPNNPMNES